MTAQTQATAAAETPRFLDLAEGVNSVYVTGISFKKAEFNMNSNKMDRAKVTLRLTALPTCQSFEAPFTSYTLYMPKADDAPATRMMMDRKIKMILFPLADLPAGYEGKVKLSEVITKAREALAEVDAAFDATVKLVEGSGIDSRTGEKRKFPEIIGFDFKEVLAKGIYESSIDDDLDTLSNGY